MSSQIVLRDAAGPADSDYNLGVRFENTTNTPLTSVTDLDTGQTIADTYTLTFTNTGGAVTVDVDCGESTKNPYQATAVAVTADGSTPNTNIVPGLSIILSASVVTGWVGIVTIGPYLSSAGSPTDRLNVGVVEAGQYSDAFRIAAVNVGADDSVSTTVDAVPGSYWTQAWTGDIVAQIRNHTDDTREHLGVKGTYTITFANWQDGTGANAGYKTADILVGGATCVTTARFDGATRYQYGVAGYDDGDDLLAGFSIILAYSTDDPSSVTITLVIGDGDDWVELAPDSGGSPGAYQTAALTLTESGETAGTITASGTAYFWFRWVIPDGTSPSALRLMRLRSRGLTI